ncbi:MAG: hypothetical protein HYU52_02210 [Acidobacteria bacterium]|nr:hypothetical protein [Acidobacteriota bacterium]
MKRRTPLGIALLLLAFASPAGAAETVAGLVEAFENVSKQELTPFFDQSVWGTAMP